MRRRMTLIWLGATAIVATVAGFLSYQAGLAAGLAARAPVGDFGPYPYWPHPFFGFGPFPLFPFLLLLFVLFLVFRGGRWWGRPAGGPPRSEEDPWKEWPQSPEGAKPGTQ